MQRIESNLSRLAIVSTIADVSDTIDFFIRYHLSIGFDRLFIFLDVSCPKTESILSEYPQVSLIHNDKDLHALWCDHAYGKKKQLLDMASVEVMARQELNVLVALERARTEGIDWLLHIDGDELFYPRDMSLQSHFENLNKLGVNNVNYLNYEAQPEFDITKDPFSNITLFKRNFFRHNLWVFNAEQRSILANNAWLPPQFFNYYQNGKSAVRVSAAVITNGVHFFELPAPIHFSINRGPVILHYPCHSISAFVKKYSRLGDFSDLWNGCPRTGRFISSLHTEARDIYQTQAEKGLQTLFNVRVLPPSDVDLQPLLSSGIFTRIENVSTLLRPRELFVRSPSMVNGEAILQKLATYLSTHTLDESSKLKWLSECRSSLEITIPLCIQLYDVSDVSDLLLQCYMVLLAARLSRPESLRNVVQEDLFNSQLQVGGCLYIDKFAGGFSGLQQRLAYLEDLGINFLYLMPMFKRPAKMNDGGFAISDYRDTADELGTLEEFKILLAALKQRNFSVAVDFVLNHTADDHPWAKAAAAGDAKYRDFYHFFSDENEVRSYLSRVVMTFPEQGNDITYNQQLGLWVWTTFNRFQWDLNYANPAVLAAMLENLFFLINLGIDAFRFDAIPHLWKRKGTPCKNQPECHAILELFAHFAKLLAPHTRIISEAIVPPEQVKHYVRHDRATVAYRPLLPITMWQALSVADTRIMSHQLQRWQGLPEGCLWLNYVNCHDDLHWPFSDPSLRELFPQMDLADFYRRLQAFYCNTGGNSFARGLPFQRARISGSTASLAGLEKALQLQDAEGIERSLRRIILLHAVMLSIGGVPLLYLGDEVATLNDYSYRHDPLLAGDSRWVHRPQKDWMADQAALATPASHAYRIYHQICNLIRVRKQHDVFAGQSMQILLPEQRSLLVYVRENSQSQLLVIGNFTPAVATLAPTELQQQGIGGIWQDLLQAQPCDLNQSLELEPYGFRWFLSTK